MGFSIVNKEQQKTLTMGELDAEAAAFWNTTVHPKYYAAPNGQRLANWFDVIGYNIHSNETKGWGDGWKSVKMSMLLVSFNHSLYNYFDGKLERTKMHEELDGSFEYYKPYFDLIDHWESKGYIPVKVTD